MIAENWRGKVVQRHASLIPQTVNHVDTGPGFKDLDFWIISVDGINLPSPIRAWLVVQTKCLRSSLK
jgi:hypothetical protein